MAIFDERVDKFRIPIPGNETGQEENTLSAAWSPGPVGFLVGPGSCRVLPGPPGPSGSSLMDDKHYNHHA